MYKLDKKDEEEAYGNPFAKINKTSVLQEARIFNQTPVNPVKCSLVLTKILYLINNGHSLSTLEATNAFFNMTKLFQSKDTILRRLVYIGIKELSQIAENVYVVTSSLTTDMNAKDNQCRPAAMRALCQITDASTFQGIERYMKQAIVDRNPAVSSAALVSSLHLAKTIPDGIKRWANEAQEALNSDNIMVQNHALGLLYHIRKSDRLAVTKLVSKLVRSNLKSPYAVCMLIRIAAKLIQDEGAGSDSLYFEFIESCLRHKSEMVVYEAANAIINLPCTSQRELNSAISVLQLMLSSSKPTNRFAAVRTLNKIAMNHPNAVMACNVDLENLITDSNRSIATLAITTLLKTGNEGSVERLMKQIASFMSEISDEFKIVVVGATRSLCAKFPRKHTVMMSFLSSMLHEEGGFEYKKSIVETIIAIIEDNPEAKEAGLAYLCEFIEDCEHTSLAVKILHLLGREGTKTAQPAKYIRYIYNRLILEKSPVRAAAVSSLAKFAAHCDDLLPQILILLERSTLDSDDEVRDRATYYHKILQQKQKSLFSNFIANTLQVSIVGLEKALQSYLQAANSDPMISEVSFDIKSVPLSTVPVNAYGDSGEMKRSSGDGSIKTTTSGPSSAAVEKIAATRQDLYAEQLSSLPELASLELGPILKSSLPVELTESETEYVIQCIKHMFRNHVVLQFDCTNTLNDQVLEDVHITMEIPEGFQVVAEVKCDQLLYNTPRSIYVALSIDPSDDVSLLLTTFTSVTLRYNVKDCDPNTNQILEDEGYLDEYLLEDLDLSIADYMQRIVKPDFNVAWQEMDEENEVEETYALSNFKTLEDAIKNLVTFMGMHVCDRSDRVAEGKTAHTVYLSGIFRGTTEVLVRAKLALASSAEGITMKLSVRSESPVISEYIASAIV